MIDEEQLMAAIQDFTIGDDLEYVILVSKNQRVRLVSYKDTEDF